MPDNPVPTDPVGIYMVSPVLRAAAIHARTLIRVPQLLLASRPADHVWTNEDCISIGLPPPFIDADTWMAELAQTRGGGATETPPAKSDAEEAGASQVKVASGGPSPSDGQHLEVSC